MNRLHALISGRVQGVSFRYHTAHVAQSLGVTGWVRNLPDGRVEVLAEGDGEKLQRLEQFLRRGPPAARVTDVYVRWQETPERDYQEFSLRW
jgi:acylphosphatase